MVDSTLSRDTKVNTIVSILKTNGASKVAIFGSYARGDYSPDSDLDIIVSFNKRISLLEFVRIERELSEATGMKIDLLTEKSISPYLIDEIRAEQRVVYE